MEGAFPLTEKEAMPQKQQLIHYNHQGWGYEAADQTP